MHCKLAIYTMMFESTEALQHRATLGADRIHEARATKYNSPSIRTWACDPYLKPVSCKSSTKSCSGFKEIRKGPNCLKNVACRKSIRSGCAPRVARLWGFWHSLTIEGYGCYFNDGGLNRMEARASTSHVRWIWWRMDEGVDVVCVCHVVVWSCGVRNGCWIWQMD